MVTLQAAGIVYLRICLFIGSGGHRREVLVPVSSPRHPAFFALPPCCQPHSLASPKLSVLRCTRSPYASRASPMFSACINQSIAGVKHEQTSKSANQVAVNRAGSSETQHSTAECELQIGLCHNPSGLLQFTDKCCLQNVLRCSRCQEQGRHSRLLARCRLEVTSEHSCACAVPHSLCGILRSTISSCLCRVWQPVGCVQQVYSM